MKIKVTMKDPDTLGDALDDAVRGELEKVDGLTAEDRAELFDSRRATAGRSAAKWFRYGEYLSVEIDTEAGTATVLAAS